MTATEIRFEIGRLTSAAKKLGLTTFLLGVPSRELLCYALDEGIGFISNDLIGVAQP
jgi:hypothetical protein